MTRIHPLRAIKARPCPDCGRVLFPARNGTWPYHRHPPAGGWCGRSGDPITNEEARNGA